MNRRALACALTAAAWTAAAAFAQVRFERLDVVVWPEYDRPAVLVMLHATLTADTTLPAIVTLPMPAIAGAPHAVAKETPDGGLLVAQHTVETTGEWSRVDLLTDLPSVRLEYYVPLDTSGPQRRFRFYWPGGIDVGRLTYEVLHPVGATGLTVDPPADGVVEADGLTFYRAQLGPRSAADSFSIALGYAKSTSQLSSPAAQAAPPPPAAAPPAGESRATADEGALNWVSLAILGLVAAILVVLMFRRPRPPAGG